VEAQEAPKSCAGLILRILDSKSAKKLRNRHSLIREQVNRIVEQWRVRSIGLIVEVSSVVRSVEVEIVEIVVISIMEISRIRNLLF
jgi:hypothetical protein